MPRFGVSVLWAALAAISCVIGFLAFLIEPPPQKVVFLDIGQGDAILLQDNTQQVLVDGGQGMAVLTKLAEEMPWFDRSIEIIISTHPDRDHLEGLLHVLERYRVGLVVLPRVAHSSQLYGEWLGRLKEAAADNTTDVRFASAGQRIQAKDLAIEVLGPSGETVQRTRGGKTNNASVVTRADFHDLSFLLTGDAETTIERQLIKQYRSYLNVDVLKAGHHGSKTSTSAELLRETSPGTVVISVGESNRYGHPHPDVLERMSGIQIFRTDQHGSVSFLRERSRWLLKTVK